MTEVTKKWFEVMKKFPRPSFVKTVVEAVKTPWDKEGQVTIQIFEIQEGKYEEQMNLWKKRFTEFRGIEGIWFKIETLMTFEEAFALLGIVPPK
jgi:hypothetical protein